MILVFLTAPSACKRKNLDEEKQELVKCPHKQFFKASSQLVDSYLLETRYLECQLLLDSSTLAYGTEEMKQVIERRKRFVLDGFATCLTNTPREESGEKSDGEAGDEDTPEPESYHARLGACMHKVMVDSVKTKELLFKPRYLTQKERARRHREGHEEQETTLRAIVKPSDQVTEKQPRDQPISPRDARSTAQSPGQGGTGWSDSRHSGPRGIGVANELAAQISAMTDSLTAPNTVFGNTNQLLDQRGPAPGTELPVGPMDWEAICRFSNDEFGGELVGVTRAAVEKETLHLVSKECLRLTGKLRTAATVNTTIANLYNALYKGEKYTGTYEAYKGEGGIEDGNFLSQETCGVDGCGGRFGNLGDGSGWGGIGSRRGGLGGKIGKIGGDGGLGAGGRRGISMREGAAQVSGKVDPNEVRAVIRAHRVEVHHCYQKGLRQNDKLAGTVRVVFLINPAGRAQECRVEENLAVAEVGKCICGRLQTWRFPQPEGGKAKISYSWTLQPGG